MTPGAEVGNLVRVIQGVSRGLPPRKITANTATTITWDVPMVINPGDVWIIEEPTWPYTCDTTSFSNANPLAVVTMNMPTGNFVDENLLISGFTVDVNGNESPDGDAPIREDWVFGAEGLSKGRRPRLPDAGHAGHRIQRRAATVFESPGHRRRREGLRAGRAHRLGDHIHDLRGRHGLADTDDSGGPDRGGRDAVADRGADGDPGEHGGLHRHHGGGHHVSWLEPLGVHLLVSRGPDLQAAAASHDALQGFDDYGAAAALWGASDTGFTVSGVFRDMADFAVLVLFQKDDPFGHPLFSYLPDGDLTGLVLDFDVTWQGIQSWESLKNAWTDWDTLDYSINGVGHSDVKWLGTPASRSRATRRAAPARRRTSPST